MPEPSKVTKALVNHLHGKRKRDSKFWQSEFSGIPLEEPPQENYPQKRFPLPILAAIVCCSVIILFLFIGSNQKELEFEDIAENSAGLKPSAGQQVSFSGSKKQKPT